MSQETQDHQEWAALDNERRARQYAHNALAALYGPPRKQIEISDLTFSTYHSDRTEDSLKAELATANKQNGANRK